jgi:MFS family permease
VVGGLIMTLVPGPDAWRWVFYVNVPIGLVALLLASRWVSTVAHGERRDVHLDLVGSLLLGSGVLMLLLPLVDADAGGLGQYWWLLVAAGVPLTAFVRWEVRTVLRGRQPLLDPRLAHTSGYAVGSLIGMVYFIGFTGIWLVLALFYQDGLGYSPLHSGLAVTPFALGVATSAAIAGRLVTRLGRVLTVTGLTATIAGLATTALLLRNGVGDTTAWATAAPLLVAGLGGGMVTSPNVTLSLQHVPVQMAGAAGGALQTAQRIGSAIGAAVLAMIFYQVLTRTGHDYATAVSDALLCAAGLMVLALLIATADLVRHRSREGSRASDPREPRGL